MIYLVYTHYHGDHNLGAGALRKAWPGLWIISTAATYMNMVGPPMAYAKSYDTGCQGTLDFAKAQFNDAAKPQIMKDGWADFIRNGSSMVAAYRGVNVWPPDLTFTDLLTIKDETAPVEIMFLGCANTNGDAVVLLPKQRIVASGDIVVHPVLYASASYPKEWIEALKRLKALDYTYLIPGHGEIQAASTYTDKLIWALEEVRARIRPLAAQGMTLDEARKKLDFSKLESVFAGEDKWKRFLLGAFYRSSVVQNAWKEAKGEPIVQGKDGG